ncbi:CbiX/SirB N-terminal domain-containing protein [Frondihabitans sp. VKM Ac-2883]|uniref:sirohydrochlorin chelatase n=1 Tax=Frondihabitans sp. VKM Ac-2883 TaxID=2783823 RepID=UPI00188C01C5|nr:cobalamin biosynthesis protein CbiX [Frondihabitans sp. VKM Ac-2883]
MTLSLAASPPALLAISHGTSSPAGQLAVENLVAAVAEVATASVRGGHVDVQMPDVPAVLSSLPPDADAVIVPLLLSAGFHVHVDLVNEADKVDRDVAIARALGPDDRIARLLARRLGEARLRRADRVVLACAGSTDARAVEDCFEMARRLGVLIHREVSVGFISAAQPPLADAIRNSREGDPDARVVVSTYLLAPGYFNDLAHAMNADLICDPLLITEGPAPRELVEVVLDRYADAAARHDDTRAHRPLTRRQRA